jgi:hypothetical protein
MDLVVPYLIALRSVGTSVRVQGVKDLEKISMTSTILRPSSGEN